jgi:hypothetical protein
MNKKFLIAWVVVFVVWMAGSFLVHGFILHDSYAQVPELFRSEADTAAYSHLMLLAHVVMAGAFVWIYQRGVEDKPWLAQGVRFGVAIALLAPIPTYTIYYVVQPTPGSLSVQGALGDSVLVIILGIITAALSKPAAAN